MATGPEVARWAEIHAKAVERYRGGCRQSLQLLTAEDAGFLLFCGVSQQVLLDYVEDFVHSGEPDAGTFCGIAEIRRQYFQEVLNARAAAITVREPQLPPRGEEWDGIAWLPRIAAKAGCFLAGSLCDQVMYGCGGDRAFVRKFGLTLPGFLKTVRDSGGERARILDDVRSR